MISKQSYIEFTAGCTALNGDAVVRVPNIRLRASAMRPTAMTAFVFILGGVPLVIAGGPGAELRQAPATAVFSCMLCVTLPGLFLTPVFCVAIRAVSQRLSRTKPGPATADNTAT